MSNLGALFLVTAAALFYLSFLNFLSDSNDQVIRNAYSRSATSEAAYTAVFCASVGGQTEVRYSYGYPAGSSYVIVDCETDTHVLRGRPEELP